MVIISHPTGNENVRNAALALSDAGLLTRFVTSISTPPSLASCRLLPDPLRRLAQRRIFPAALLQRTTSYPGRELARLFFSRGGAGALTSRVDARFSVDAVYRSIDHKTARLLPQFPRTRAVYCYEDAAVETFRRAKSLGLRTIYELPTPYWRLKEEISREESQLQPAWAGTLRFNQEGAAKLARKDEELRLADLIVAPSEFVAESLSRAGVGRDRIRVVPYASPPVAPDIAGDDPRRPLRVIYVGNLGQGKGISYLISAWAGLKTGIELTVIGRMPANAPSALEDFLRQHRYFPSLPHEEVLREMRRNDVLVLPTLFEGMALVLLEGMSQGLAILTTPNAGAGEIVRDGMEGFVVPIRSAVAIGEKLSFFVQDRPALARMRRSARDRAGGLTWENYRRTLAGIVNQALPAV